VTEQTLRDHLIAFGLSAKEVDAYLVVLQSGQATTSEVAQAADISQGYVYEIAEKLVDRGLISLDESTTPTRLRARPPEEALGTFSERLDRLGDELDRLYSRADPGDPAVELVHSRSTVRKRIARTVDRAENEVVMTLPASEFSHLRGALAEARDRGVTIYLQLVAPLDKLPTDTDWDAYGTVVKTWAATPPVTVIADEQAGVMGAHSILSGRHDSAYALVFSQPDIAGAFFGNTVSNFWPMGEVRHVAEPDPLPSTYEHVRTAVTNAALHRAAGRSLRADVTIRGVGSESTTTYEGVPVVDVRQHMVGEPTNEFPIENSLVFDTPDGRIAAGGNDGSLQPFYEGYAAVSVTLFDGSEDSNSAVDGSE
jgi:sugar-specific transcriptional regulator TrmB